METKYISYVLVRERDRAREEREKKKVKERKRERENIYKTDNGRESHSGYNMIQMVCDLRWVKHFVT